MDILNNKLTSRYLQVLADAKLRALTLNKTQVEPEDIFLTLLSAKGSMAWEILNKKSTTVPLDKNSTTPLINAVPIDFSKPSQLLIEKSVYAAAEFEHYYVGTEHLLFALLSLEDSATQTLLARHKIDCAKILEQLNLSFKAMASFNELPSTLQAAGKNLLSENALENELLNEIERLKELPSNFDEQEHQTFFTHHTKKQKKSILDSFALNLTDPHVQTKIDPLIGRETETQRLIQILLRRTKNNPVLLGEPGVGKTAIVEGLAKKILMGDVPDMLLNKKIYSLDVNLLIAGAMMRGEFEARLKQVIDAVKRDPDIILFIDELHNIVGAGSLTGTMDAANILKPALSRGELRCIGATTHKEYKKYIEDDAALERRFQAIEIREPSAAETLKILAGIKINYEQHHLVKILPEALAAAVDLSEHYLTDKFLPDKAIDLIDEAAAYIKLNSAVINEDLRKLKLLEEKIDTLENQKQNQVKQEKYAEALKTKASQLQLMNDELGLKNKISLKPDQYLGQVTAADIARIVNQITGIPLNNLLINPLIRQTGNQQPFLNFEKQLAKKIIGQNEVLKEIIFFLKRAQAGLSGQHKPLGSFMFLGPSGVGKTETAKVLAQQFFSQHHQREALIRLDMSEFSESFNVSRLIGSPAGYVGFKEGGRLTEAVKHNPYSVVLFDEIEKAHPQVFNILLQILDAGQLSDATGKKIDFQNTIIILTSNLGLNEFNKSALGFGQTNTTLEFEETKKMVLHQVKQKFNPEFINRLDKILIFKPLDLKAIEKIVALQLIELTDKLKAKKINAKISLATVKKLARNAYAPDSGARNVKKIIADQVEHQLIDQILSGKIKARQEIEI